MTLFLDAPRLADWITISEAAQLMGVTKQAVNKMVQKGYIKSVHKFGMKPNYVISETEILNLIEVRSAKTAERARRRKSARTVEDEYINDLVKKFLTLVIDKLEEED